ncbi:MAG: xanthine phosphoribosyltransferase [Clostridia bacterium]|nr:xanthine phosphoribosyltransferase [Clostridia bacterium]
MDLLKQMILEKGHVINEDILKVDSFINHQVNSKLMQQIGIEFYKYFKYSNITKVFTIESSGIAPAVLTSCEFNVPMVILKKQTSTILNDNTYQAEVKSFTKNNTYNLTLSKEYISPDDKILIIDDFLANGEAAKGAIKLVEDAGAKVAGIGIVIEKSFQPGRKVLEDLGYDVYSLARIKSLENNKIEFME